MTTTCSIGVATCDAPPEAASAVVQRPRPLARHRPLAMVVRRSMSGIGWRLFIGDTLSVRLNVAGTFKARFVTPKCCLLDPFVTGPTLAGSEAERHWHHRRGSDEGVSTYKFATLGSGTEPIVRSAPDERRHFEQPEPYVNESRCGCRTGVRSG